MLSVYPELIEDLSPQRAQIVNAASEMRLYSFPALHALELMIGVSVPVETHPLAREASRKRLMKNARKNMEAGIEAQKV